MSVPLTDIQSIHIQDSGMGVIIIKGTGLQEITKIVTYWWCIIYTTTGKNEKTE